MLHTTPYHIVLGSNSPRRRELLAGIDIPFQTLVLPNIDESYPPATPPQQVPELLARQKAEAYRTHLAADPQMLLITADTIVLLGDQIIGKPTTPHHARHILAQLSARTHTVITGVCLTTPDRQTSFSAHSQVTFATLTPAEIDYYVDKYLPMDKAGAYGVQEWIGYVAVEHIQGSYFNIMGLPIQRLYQEMKRLMERT